VNELLPEPVSRCLSHGATAYYTGRAVCYSDAPMSQKVDAEKNSPWRRNLYAAWISQVLSITGFGFVLPFVPFYIQELGVTDPGQLRIWTGVLSSAPAVSMAVMAPVWGILADRFGRKLMMLRAMFFGALVMSLLSLTRSVQAVLVLRIMQGLFTGTVGAAAALVAGGTPRGRLSSALGILSSSTFIGISIGPAIGGLVAEWAGYRTSFLVGGALLAVGFLSVLLLVKEIDADEPSPESASGEPGRIRALLSGGMMGLFLLVLMLRFVRALPIPFLPLLVQEMRGALEGSASTTGWISASRGLVTAAAALTLTRLGDRRGRLPLIAVYLALAGALSLPTFFAGGIWGFSAFLVASTFFLGGVEPLVQAELSSRVPSSRRGLLFGVQSSVASLGWFLAPLVGSVISIRFSIRHIFLTLAFFLFITVGVVILVHRRRVRHG
jgi:DHA1 family multidrug resistance protein-like MFS transporter